MVNTTTRKSYELSYDQRQILGIGKRLAIATLRQACFEAAAIEVGLFACVAVCGELHVNV